MFLLYPGKSQQNQIHRQQQQQPPPPPLQQQTLRTKAQEQLSAVDRGVDSQPDHISSDRTKQQHASTSSSSSSLAKASAATATAAVEIVLVVIISDRKDGIVPTIASILMTSSHPVDVVLIGRHSINQEVREHFGNRIHSFTSLSVQDVTDDLKQGGHPAPIWMWPEWHTSINNPKWSNENTLHVGPWDNLHTHAHELNHVRFYLPHLSIFKDKDYFFFLDDDLLIRKDLSVLASQTLAGLDSDRGMVGPCNIWMWNSDCFHFEFQSQKDYILDMPALYGDREVCKTDSESHCVPENYGDFVSGFIPEHGKKQHAWNFGFSLFALENWRTLDLTAKYERVMKESYRLHVFPETSLTFGLGVAYIAFAGAVECWNEDHFQVRDGFGFIEQDRFEQTFGKDFLETKVDIMHYTGPDKPWVPESRIDPWALQPWLDTMEHEKMLLPLQLPGQPTDNLFTVLASEFTGVGYIMSKLDQHPEVCASGESDKAETGFPLDSLHPDGLGWFPSCSTKKGCTFNFVNTSVSELLADMTDDKTTPRRCAIGYDPIAENDGLANHLPRICNFVRQLGNVYDAGKITRLWINAFVAEDRDYLGCGCNRGTKAKGIKVLPEWIAIDHAKQVSMPKLNLDDTKVHGSKIIRLKRRNLWARYKTMMIAEKTGVFNPASPAQKKTQLDTLSRAGNLTLDIHHLDWHMSYMQAMDEAGDNWARDHASEILWLEYDDCIEDATACFDQIYGFIGADATRLSKSKEDLYLAMFQAFDIDDSMEYVANAVEIREKMGLHGWDHFISKERHRPIQLLLYNENIMAVKTRHYPGINTTTFGSNPTSVGFGSKFSGAIALLQHMPEDTMVVLGDLANAWVNFPLGGYNSTIDALAKFRSSFVDLTSEHAGAVVVSAETFCCSSSLSHFKPGEFLGEAKERKVRSCVSGTSGCEWKDDKNALAWKAFMTNLAQKRSSESPGRAFLDAALITGMAGDIVKLLEIADIGKDEDDRAILSDVMYRAPEMIVLDQSQVLFGESETEIEQISRSWCLKEQNQNVANQRQLVDLKPTRQALFMRSPRSLGCQSSESRASLSPQYPAWGDEDIQFKSVVDHIDRVVAMEDIVVLRKDYRRTDKGLDYRQGPEIPYIVDDEGVWASRLIRDRTDNVTFFQRLIPTEQLTIRAQTLLMSEGLDTPRWPALKRSVRAGGFPYWAWYGDFKICNEHNRGVESIPIFTTCARTDCRHAFPMPTYMTEVDSQVSEDNWHGFFRESEENYPWESKVQKVVWRGALSEADVDKFFTSVRWRTSKLVHELKSDDFDVGVTGVPAWVAEQMDIDLSPVGGAVDGIRPMTGFQKYKAIMDMDGNSWSSRFGTLLCYNSVVVKVEPRYVEYFSADLKPWVHFVPVKDDLSDLVMNVAWVLDPKNDKAVRRIVSSANQWCSKTLLPNELARDMLDIMEVYVGSLDRANPDWQGTWNKKREQISSPSSDFDLIKVM